jgi:hypothetical protein
MRELIRTLVYDVLRKADLFSPIYAQDTVLKL